MRPPKSKRPKITAEVIVTEAVKEAQRYADGLKKQSAEKLSEAVGIVKDTLLNDIIFCKVR